MITFSLEVVSIFHDLSLIVKHEAYISQFRPDTTIHFSNQVGLLGTIIDGFSSFCSPWFSNILLMTFKIYLTIPTWSVNDPGHLDHHKVVAAKPACNSLYLSTKNDGHDSSIPIIMKAISFQTTTLHVAEALHAV